ncbi:Manganese transport system membrane protein MntB [Planctomycetes bacterium Pla163]|uniref:Manganese transport system membrane protein MntB n=1 Tax=Rohdeia mirabilis TaxID=2528008 RepID=A0A518D013_9BACT|nr:Manganese transport system membrane protein MntB [Planctomycetes bacterium Pla163]
MIASTALATLDGASAFVDAVLFGAGQKARLVSLVAALLGATAGMVGTFVVLRGRSLASDALSHATLPGVVLAFLAAGALGLDARHPLTVMLGAAGSALAALIVLAFLRRGGTLPDDTATGAVLSGAFGLGVVLLTVVQGLGIPDANGLDHVLFGQVATTLRTDLYWIGGVGLVAFVAVVAFRRPLSTVAFDEAFAERAGLSVARVDALLFVLLFAVTVAGLPIVGAVLVVALVVLPSAAARFFTDSIGVLIALSGVFGAASAHLGASLSYALPDAPAGAVIVLVAGLFFVASMLLAPGRGVFARHRTRSAELDAARSRALVREVEREAARSGSDPRAAAAVLGLGAGERRLLERAFDATSEDLR